MKEWLYTIFCIGTFVIGMVVAADVAVQVRHKLSGSPLAHKVFQSIIDAKEETIQSQGMTIQSQKAVINQQRKLIADLRKQIREEEESDEAD